MDSHCYYCQSINYIVQYKTSDIFDNNYEIVKCSDCNSYFLTPNPSYEILSKAYDDSYYGESEKKFSFPILEKVLDYFRMGRARKLKTYINPGANILDIGCGNGRFLMYLNKLGNYNLFGTELEGNSARRTSEIKEINLKIGFIEENDFEENFFDAITLFHVFEHLHEPKKILQIISKILKSDGILMISFPNIDSLQSRIFKGNWLHLDPPRHLFFFSPKDFEKIIHDLGYELIDRKFLSFEQNPYGMVQSILNKFSFKRELLFESLKGNKSYIKDYSKYKLMLQKLFFLFAMPFFMISDIFESLFNKGATVEYIFKKK